LDTFGEKLRKQREERGVTLEALANTTKISTRMLKALEDEHFDQLPGGVFNKGFVRAYARQVGLDEEQAINDYLAALAERQVNSQPIQPNFRGAGSSKQQAVVSTSSARSKYSGNVIEDRRTHSDRRNEVRRVDDRLNGSGSDEARLGHAGSHDEDRPASLSETLIESHQAEDSLGDIPSPPPSFLNLSTASEHETEEHPHTRSGSAVPSSRSVRWEWLVAPLILVTLALAFWTYRRNHPAARPEPMPSPEPPVSAQTAAPAKTPAPAPTNSSANSSGASSSTPKLSPSVSEAESDVTKFTPTHTQVATPKLPPKFTLVIRASETSWVAITADGQPVAQETLIAPANTSVRANREITVKVGNASGVSFMLDGKEFPAEGNAGEVRTYTFDANGLRPAATPAPEP